VTMGFIERYRQLEVKMGGYIKRCPHPYIVVTGCSRSGTSYASKVFKQAGLDIGHHVSLGKDGVVADVAMPYKCLQDCLVLHQVRNPINQIPSMTTSMAETWKYIASIIDIRDCSLIRSAMTYWHEWNKMTSRIAQYTYRVENMQQEWSMICDIIGLPGAPFPDVSKTTNTRAGKFKPLTWKILQQEDALLCNQIQNLASLYGYSYVK